MKAELTPELKERFFALYIGQQVKFPTDSHGLTQSGKFSAWELPMVVDGNWPILLRPLDQITDEEAIEAAKIIWGKESEKDMHTAEEGRWYLIYRRRPERKEYPELIDFLRSKGFAIPYMGYSIAHLVSAGWVKLIERTDKPE